MLYWLIPLAVVLLILISSAVCFFKIFFAFGRGRKKEEYPIPEGEIYQPYREQMIKWIKEARELEHTEVSIQSYDGLRLCGRYYEKKKGAPIEILFHGYKGTALRDLSGGIYRCFELDHNALVVDHRAAGASEGRVITFGARESRDCLSWIDFVVNNIDSEAKIIITGISMGAATVMSAAGEELPQNVIGVLADCGYTSTEDIVKKVMKDMKLPPNILYPFARLGAIIFGWFDPNKKSPIMAMKKCRLPIIFLHGDTDEYVPCYMSEQNYEACVSDKKRLVIIHGAGHGLCFPVDIDGYLAALHEFFDPLFAAE